MARQVADRADHRSGGRVLWDSRMTFASAGPMNVGTRRRAPTYRQSKVEPAAGSIDANVAAGKSYDSGQRHQHKEPISTSPEGGSGCHTAAPGKQGYGKLGLARSKRKVRARQVRYRTPTTAPWEIVANRLRLLRSAESDSPVEAVPVAFRIPCIRSENSSKNEPPQRGGFSNARSEKPLKSIQPAQPAREQRPLPRCYNRHLTLRHDERGFVL
jgi:hypothetical protein